MRKENLFLVINTIIITIIAGLFLLLYINLVPKNPEDKLFNQVVELRNTVNIENVPSTGTFSVIASRSRAFDNSSQEVGIVYRGLIRNSYKFDTNDTYGEIEILVGITPTDRIFVQIVTLKQTSTYLGGIQDYVYEYFRDVDYLNIETLPVVDADPDAGATATDSTGAIKTLVSRIVDLHFGIIRDQFELWFGEGYSKAIDETFDATPLVINREIVRNQNNSIIGYVYKMTGSGDYDNGEDIITGSISVYVAFDIDNVIIGILLPEDEYGHSKGSFRNRNFNYLQQFVGATADEFAALQIEHRDIAAGATGSRGLIDILLNALSEVILG